MKTNRKFKLISFLASGVLLFALIIGGLFGHIAPAVRDAVATNSDQKSGTIKISDGSVVQSPASILLTMQEAGSYQDKNGNPLYYHESFGVVYCDKTDKTQSGAKFFTNFIDGIYKDEIIVSVDDLTLLSENKNNTSAVVGQISAQINNGEVYMVKNTKRDGSLASNIVYENTNAIIISNVKIDGKETGNLSIPANSNIYSDGSFYFFYYLIGSTGTVTTLNPHYKTEISGAKTNVIEFFTGNTELTTGNATDLNGEIIYYHERYGIIFTDGTSYYQTIDEETGNYDNEIILTAEEIDELMHVFPIYDANGNAQIGKVYINVYYVQKVLNNDDITLSEIAGVYGAIQGGQIYVLDGQAENQLNYSETDVYIYNGRFATKNPTADLMGYYADNTYYKVQSGSDHWYYDGYSAKEVTSGTFYLAKNATGDELALATYNPSSTTKGTVVGAPGNYSIIAVSSLGANKWFVLNNNTWYELSQETGDYYTGIVGGANYCYYINPATNTYSRVSLDHTSTEATLDSSYFARYCYLTGEPGFETPVYVPESAVITVDLTVDEKPSSTEAGAYGLVKVCDSKFTSAQTNELYVPLTATNTPFTKIGNDYYFAQASLGDRYENFYNELYYINSNSDTIGITTKLINVENGLIVDNNNFASDFEYFYNIDGIAYVAPSNSVGTFNYYIGENGNLSGVSESNVVPFEHYFCEYQLTGDETYIAGKTYYVLDGDNYVEQTAGVDYNAGDSISAGTVYECIRIYISNNDTNLTYLKRTDYSENQEKITESSLSENLKLNISFGEFGNKIVDPSGIPVYLYKNGVVHSSATLSGNSTDGYYFSTNISGNDLYGSWELLIGCAKNGLGVVEPYNNGYQIKDGANYYTYLTFSLVKESDYYVTTAMPKIHNAEPNDTKIVVEDWFNMLYIDENYLPYIQFDSSKFRVNVTFYPINSSSDITYSISRTNANSIVISKDGVNKTYSLAEGETYSQNFRFYLSELGYYQISYQPIIKLANATYNDLIISNSETYQDHFNLTNFGYQLQYTQYSATNPTRENFFAYAGEFDSNDFASASGVLTLDDLFAGSKSQAVTLSSEKGSISFNDLISNSSYGINYKNNIIAGGVVSTNQAPVTFINTFSGALRSTYSAVYFKDATTGVWTSDILKSTDFFSKAGDYIIVATFDSPDVNINGGYRQYFAFTIKNSQTDYTITSSNIIFNNGTGYEWFDGSQWQTLTYEADNHYSFTNSGDVTYFYINETTESYFIATDNTYETSQTTLYLTANKNESIVNGSFTNGDVTLKLNANASQFDVKPQILVQYSGLNYGEASNIYTGQNIGISYNAGATIKTGGYILDCDEITFTGSRKYVVTLYYGPTVWNNKATFVSWNFSIDKNPITYKPYQNETELGDAVQIIGGNSYFRLTYGDSLSAFVDGHKTSGANISAYYYYTPIVPYDIGTGTNVGIEVQSGYIQTHYKLDFAQTTTALDYNYGTQKFVQENPGLYEFVMIDQAGNKSTYFIFLDNVSPEYVITDLSNDSTSPRYSLSWGNYKAVEIDGYVTPTKNNKAHNELSKISANVVTNINSTDYLYTVINSFNINFYPDSDDASDNAEANYQKVNGIYTFNTTGTYSFNDEEAIQNDYKDYLKITSTGYTILRTKRNEGQFIAYAKDSLGNQGGSMSKLYSFDLSQTSIYVKNDGTTKENYADGEYPKLVNDTSSNLDYLFMTAITEGTTNFGDWKVATIKVKFYPLDYSTNVYSTTWEEITVYDKDDIANSLLSTLSPSELIKIIKETLNGQSENGKYVITRTYDTGFKAPLDLFEAQLDNNDHAIMTSGVYYKVEATSKWYSKAGDIFTEITDVDLIASLNTHLQATGASIVQNETTYAIYERDFYFEITEGEDYGKYYYEVSGTKTYYSFATFGFTLTKKGIETDTTSKTWTVFVDRVKPIDKAHTYNTDDYVGEYNKLKLQPQEQDKPISENLSFNEFVLDGSTISLDTNLLTIAFEFLESKYGSNISSNPYAFFNLRASIYYVDSNGTFSVYDNKENVLIGDLSSVSLNEGTYKVVLTDTVSSTISDFDGDTLPANSVSFVFKGTIKSPEAQFVENFVMNADGSIGGTTLVLDDSTNFVSVKTGKAITFVIEDPIDFYQAKVNGSKVSVISNGNLSGKTLGLYKFENSNWYKYENGNWNETEEPSGDYIVQTEHVNQGNYGKHGATRYYYTVTLNTTAENVYGFTIQFHGDKDNYKDKDNNYYNEKIYTCVIDSTLPTFNENGLISDDANHGNYITEAGLVYNIKEERSFADYPFYMTSTSTFSKATKATEVESKDNINFANILESIYGTGNTSDYLAKLDTYKIFLRQVTANGPYSKPSTMPGEDEVIDKPNFSGIAGEQYYEISYGTSLASAIASAGFDTNSGIQMFEIIEVDAAGNYQSYFVFYSPFANAISLDINYQNNFIEQDGETSTSLITHENNFANGGVVNAIPTYNDNKISNLSVISLNSINKYLVVTINESPIYLKPSDNFNNEIISHINGAGVYTIQIFDKKTDNNCTITINVAGDKVAFKQLDSVITASYNPYTYSSKLLVTKLTINGNSVTSSNLLVDNSSPAKYFSTIYKDVTDYNLPASESSAYVFDLTDNFGRKTEKSFSSSTVKTGFYIITDDGSSEYLENNATTGKHIYFSFNKLLFEDLTNTNFSLDGDEIGWEISGGIVTFKYKPQIKSTITINASRRDGSIETYKVTLDTTLPVPTFQKSSGTTLTPTKADDDGWKWNIEQTTSLTIILNNSNPNIEADLYYIDRSGNVYTYKNIFKDVNIKTYSASGNYTLIIKNTALGTKEMTYDFKVVNASESFFSVVAANGETLNQSFVDFVDGDLTFVQYFTNNNGFNIVLNDAFELEFIDEHGDAYETNIATHNSATFGGGDSVNYWLYRIKSKAGANVEFEKYVKVTLVTSATSTIKLDGSTNSEKEILISKANGSTISFTTNVASGNYLTAYIYYKSLTNLAKTVVPTSTADATLSVLFNEPGLFYLELRDLAGNYVTFDGETYLTIVNLSKASATAKIGQGEISLMNGLVLTPGSIISVDNFSHLVNANFNVIRDGAQYLSVTGKEITLNETGFYQITLSGIIAGGEVPGTTYNVFVINPESARLGFEYSLPNNCEITNVYQAVIGSDEWSNYSDYEQNKLALSYAKNGNSHFLVEVTANHGGNKGSESFSFEITIANNTPVISSNVNFAETTTKTINLSFNPHDIYLQQGACRITIKERTTGTVLRDFVVNATNEDKTETISISSDGFYDIQVWSESGETLFYWTSVGYKTPLNTVAIVLIVIGSVGALTGVVLFIVLRTKMKVR